MGARFELAVAFDHSSFQDCPFQPLRHPTKAILNVYRYSYIRRTLSAEARRIALSSY